MQYWVGLLALLILLVIGFSMRSTNTLGGPTYDSGDLASQYDQSLWNPTLVRLTHTGSLESDRLNQRRDCLTLHNPSNLIQTCTENQQSTLKTSSQWYLARPDPKLVIVEPTGWLDLANPTQYWFSHLIDFDEYAKRLASSQLAPCKYPEFQQQEPF